VQHCRTVSASAYAAAAAADKLSLLMIIMHFIIILTGLGGIMRSNLIRSFVFW
jgi:hypothetical protein